MLTYQPFFEPLRTQYRRNKSRRKAIRKAVAVIMFFLGATAYAICLWAILEIIIKEG